MTSPDTVDRDPAHLDPDFAEKLDKAITLANVFSRTRAGEPKYPGFDHWALFEGYRSQERQDWLYAQGRARPGTIVTWRRHSKHTERIAGDVCWVDPAGEWHWDGPDSLWAILGHCARANGLKWGGDWQQQDLPHVEAS